MTPPSDLHEALEQRADGNRELRTLNLNDLEPDELADAILIAHEEFQILLVPTTYVGGISMSVDGYVHERHLTGPHDVVLRRDVAPSELSE